MTSENMARRLGSTGPTIFPPALGCMGMSGMYGRSDDDESIATIQPALDQGVTLLDTGDFYGVGHNEMLIGRALRGRREKALVSRNPETKIFPVLEELGIGVTALGVLSRGLLSGSAPSGPGDFRSYLPRFRGENLARNKRLVDVLKEIASEKGMSPSQLAIAWVLAKGDSIVPVIGARKRTQLSESLGAVRLRLSADIENAIPASAIAGTRYDEHQMKMLDSERGKGS